MKEKYTMSHKKRRKIYGLYRHVSFYNYFDRLHRPALPPENIQKNLVIDRDSSKIYSEILGECLKYFENVQKKLGNT